MHRAMLGGVPGVAEVRARRGTGSTLDCRGTFAFEPRFEAAMMQLFEARTLVELDSVVEGEPRRLRVRLMSLAVENGTAFFEGSAEAA